MMEMLADAWQPRVKQGSWRDWSIGTSPELFLFCRERERFEILRIRFVIALEI